MLKFSFKKLVRDNIVDQQLANGARPTFRQLSESEHKAQLVEKIVEEAREIATARAEDVAAEIADVQQALDDLRELAGVSSEEVTRAQRAKSEKNGTFRKGLYVEFVEVANDDKWVEYYRNNSDRYPEIK
jgi:predicted house-cleaning noncanonical NTP pyrophosphatase (MazG superfamily)